MPYAYGYPLTGKSDFGGFYPRGARWWCGTKSEASAAAHNLLFSVENKIRPRDELGMPLSVGDCSGSPLGGDYSYSFFTVFWFDGAK